MIEMTKHLSATAHLRVPRNKMSPAWQAVHDFFLARGFVVAAHHMGDIMKATTPSQYWKAQKINERCG